MPLLPLILPTVSSSLVTLLGCVAVTSRGPAKSLMRGAQGSEAELESSWMMSDILGVGNAVVGDKLKQLMMAIQRIKASESSLHRRTADLARGNSAVAGLQARISDLERELALKRKAVENLALQLDMENTPSRSAGGGGGGGGGTSGSFQASSSHRRYHDRHHTNIRNSHTSHGRHQPPKQKQRPQRAWVGADNGSCT